MRYLASVKYNGINLYGFQKLNGKKTVQGELERVLSKISKSEVAVKGAGRTDRFVHALDQKVHFDLSINISVDSLKEAMNSMLDEAIYVNNISIVDDDFHARFNVKKKNYEYIINTGEYDPLINNNVYNYNYPLDLKAMKKASKYLIGIHSFKAFVSGERENYTSIIYKISFKKRGKLIYIRFSGKSFYRYMVRNMVGALILVGKGTITPNEFNDMILKEDNIHNYMTVPAQGLYLISVEY